MKRARHRAGRSDVLYHGLNQSEQRKCDQERARRLAEWELRPTDAELRWARQCRLALDPEWQEVERLEAGEFWDQLVPWSATAAL